MFAWDHILVARSAPAAGRFEAPTRFDRLFTGVAAPPPAYVPVGDRTGTEHIGPEDMWDADYGRLLHRAHELYDRKGMASLSIPSWNQIAAWLRDMAELRKSGVVAA